LLLGIEEKANEQFAVIEERYNSLTNLASGEKVKKRPVVFSGEIQGGNWYAVGGQSFLARLFKDACADYFLKDDTRSGGVTLDFETVYNQADEAGYWRIVSSYPGTFSNEALKEQDPQYADFRVFREKGIIYCNMREKPFYESMPAEPEVILADLLHIFHPELLPDHISVYYTLLK
jgi:iron complex transport system substrate-binding protein